MSKWFLTSKLTHLRISLNKIRHALIYGLKLFIFYPKKHQFICIHQRVWSHPFHQPHRNSRRQHHLTRPRLWSQHLHHSSSHLHHHLHRFPIILPWNMLPTSTPGLPPIVPMWPDFITASKIRSTQSTTSSWRFLRIIFSKRSILMLLTNRPKIWLKAFQQSRSDSIKIKNLGN